MADVVDIVLPDGGAATVPEGDLTQALAAGAKVAGGGAAPGAQSSDDAFLNSGLGQGITGVLGAGRTVTGGLTDLALSEAGNLYGGEGARKDVLHAFSRAKEANPYADMAGEAAGLFLPGSGSALTQAGEAVEHGITGLVGKGLGGSIVSGAGRGAAEGLLFGAQHQITEDTLGDPAIGGQTYFQNMGEQALLGGALGGAFGAAGYGVSKALGGLLGEGSAAATRAANEDLTGAIGAAEPGGPYRRMGPMSDVAKDELAGGVEGSGKAVATQMDHAQQAITDLTKTGLTSEQATSLTDRLMGIAQSGGKDVAGAIDALADTYSGVATSGNAERKAVLQRAFGQQAKLVQATEDVVDKHAVDLVKAGTKALRMGADVADEVSFTQRPDIFEKLTHGVDRSAARDALTGMLQDVTDTLTTLDEMPTKGGMGPSAFKKLAAIQEESAAILRNADATPGEMMMAATKMKQGIGRNVNFEVADHLKSVADRELGGTKLDPTGGLYQRLRNNLEDAGIWGKAADANKQINGAFAEAHPRTQHFLGELGVSIDRTDLGRRLTDLDYSKTRGMLDRLTGGDTDDMLQGVISANRWIDGLERRINVARDYGTASPAQLKQMGEGLTALREFRDKFDSARREVSAANQVKAQRLVERETPGIGGLIGLVGDVVTKPLTTMERLANVRRGAESFGNTISKATKAAMDWRGSTAAVRDAVAPRAKDVVVKDIEKIRELANNPEAMAAHTEKVTKSLGSVAPKIAAEARATTQRAIMFLAQKAPPAAVPLGMMGIAAATKRPRYSDQQIADWESQRNAIFGSAKTGGGMEHVLSDVKRGRVDRDAVEAIKFVSPQLFAQVQQNAMQELQQMAVDGRLEKLSYQHRAAIATVLEVPPDETWTPNFIAAMQAAKSYQPPPGASSPGGAPPMPNAGVTKRAVKLDTTPYQSPAGAIAGRTF